jgi:excisionase family DNA binding protein
VRRSVSRGTAQHPEKGSRSTDVDPAERSLNLAFPHALVEAIAERVAELLADAMSSQPEPWIRVEEAAEYLACPRSRIYALVSKREIPHQKDGSRLLFRRSELDEFIENGGATR